MTKHIEFKYLCLQGKENVKFAKWFGTGNNYIPLDNPRFCCAEAKINDDSKYDFTAVNAGSRIQTG